MRIMRKALSMLLAAATLACILSGCKVVEIPDDVWFRSSSSSSSSFVEELVELDSAVPVEDGSILYQDVLDGARVYVAQNPDTTESLIYESASGERTRLYVSPVNREILYPLLSDNGSQVAFMLVGLGSQISDGAYLGELYTVSVSGGEAAAHEMYVRSYPDNPRGYEWYSEDTLFISSAMYSTGDQEDCIGFFNITNDQMNNIVGGEHPVDSARQGTISPDGRLIAYSGFYANNSKYAHCIFDIESGETTYWFDKSYSGLTDSVTGLTLNPFIDNEHIIKTRSYNMDIDADGNIIHDDTPEVEEELSGEEELAAESSLAAESAAAEESESAAETGSEVSEATDETADETSETSSDESTEETTDESSEKASDETEEENDSVLVNSIFSLDVYTGEQTLLIENAYYPCLSKDRTKLYFHQTIYSSLLSASDKADLSKRVFCYDMATGEITEVTETLGITSSYDIILLEQRLNGYEG